MKFKIIKLYIFLSYIIITSFFWIPYIFPYFSNVDEPGYFASATQLAKGKLLYRDVFEAKGPGIMYIFKFFVKLFPLNYSFFLHLFMFLIIIFDSILIYKILQKKTNLNFSFLGFLFPIFLCCFYPVDMITGPEIFVNFIILTAYFIFIYQNDLKNTSFFIGFLLGLSFLFKPFGVLYILCFTVLIIFKSKKVRPTILYILGCALPLICFLSYLLVNNIFNDFHLWTIEYPIFVSKTIPLWRKIYYFFPMISRLLLLNPFYIVFGLPLIFNKKKFKENFDVILLFIISLLWGGVHGLAFPHHYVMCVSFIFIISILGLYDFNINLHQKNEFGFKKIINSLIILSVLQSLIYWNGFDFYKKWIRFIKEKKWQRQYEEKRYIEILNFLKENVNKKEDKIIIWGLNPKIYVLSGISPGTKFISSVEPVNGIVYYDVSKIIQFKKAEEIFIEEIKNKDVKFFIDATFNSLIGIPHYTLDKYPKIKKVIDNEYEVIPSIYSGCVIYKHILKKN